MLDLDEAITAWRQRMLVAGIRTPVPLDELESHLRDDVDEQMNSGMEAQQAFELAVARVGLATELKTEFQKAKLNQPMKLEPHKLLREILVIISVLAIGVGLILPAIAKWREQGTLAAWEIGVLLIGAATVAWGGTCGALCVLKRRKA